MTVENLPGRSRPELSEDSLLTSLRLHDQMISCLTFVIDKAIERNPHDADFEPLYASLELISDKRSRVVETLKGITEETSE